MSIPQQFMSIISPYPIKAVDIMPNILIVFLSIAFHHNTFPFLPQSPK